LAKTTTTTTTTKIQRKGLDYTKDQVKDFHEAFGHIVTDSPTAIPTDVALARTKWTAEELVEFLYATANNDLDLFRQLVRKLSISLFETERKIIAKDNKVVNVLVEQMDALTDVNYFVQGSFVVAGTDPQPLFDIVQDANMSKLWEDGKPRYDAANGNKIMKPEGWSAPEPKLTAEIERQIKNSQK
jgi:energy-coupling factor transport system permease protein